MGAYLSRIGNAPIDAQLGRQGAQVADQHFIDDGSTRVPISPLADVQILAPPAPEDLADPIALDRRDERVISVLIGPAPLAPLVRHAPIMLAFCRDKTQ